MKFAITTPTGKIGSKLVNELFKRGGNELFLLTDNREKVRDFTSRGAKVFEGDLADKDFFARATQNVDALFFVVPMNSRSGKVFDEFRQVVDSGCNAIEKNHIQRVVFVSSFGAHLAEGSGPIRYLHEAEEHLRKVSPNLTVLRPVFYMDQFMGWMKDIAEAQALHLPFAETTNLPLIATRDVATYAADVLTDNKWTGKRIVPLYGPRDYSYGEVAQILGKTLGIDVKPVEIKPEKLAEMLKMRGWSQAAANHNVEMFKAFAAGKLQDELPRSQWVKRPTTFEDFAKYEFQPAYDRMSAVTSF